VNGVEARTAAGGGASFVGREPELRVLGERLERALAGTGGLVLVAGEAGIGKTRMLGEFALTARERGALTLWGSSFEGDWHPPYGPWLEVLEDAVRSLDADRLRQALGRGAPVLARLLPELGPALGDLPEVASLSPEEERFRLFDAVAQFLVAVARRSPVVLVLDDLHWTDRDSLQLLAYCGRFVGRGGLLLAGAYRDAPLDFGHPLVDTLAVLCRQAGYEHLGLGGLSRGEVADYLARTTRQPPPEALARAIHAETGGNPFYVRELWRHLVDERVAVQQHGRWVLTAGLGGAGVPQGVRHVVARRLARLSATAGAALHAAAALTAGFDFPILQTITGLPDEVLLGCLDEAVDAGLIHATRRPSGTYDFVHPIVRQTLYDDLNPDRRARLHRRLAEALERAHADGAVDAAAEIAVQYHASAALPAPTVASGTRWRPPRRPRREPPTSVPSGCCGSPATWPGPATPRPARRCGAGWRSPRGTRCCWPTPSGAPRGRSTPWRRPGPSRAPPRGSWPPPFAGCGTAARHRRCASRSSTAAWRSWTARGTSSGPG
jgi:predicted ATPase